MRISQWEFEMMTRAEQELLNWSYGNYPESEVWVVDAENDAIVADVFRDGSALDEDTEPWARWEDWADWFLGQDLHQHCPLVVTVKSECALPLAEAIVRFLQECEREVIEIATPFCR